MPRVPAAPWPALGTPRQERGSSLCVFLDSVFPCLASSHHRPEVMAEARYTSPVFQLWKARKSHTTNSPTNLELIDLKAPFL